MRAKRVGLSLSLSFRTHTYTVSSKSSTTQGTSKHKRFLNYSVSRSCCSCSCFFIVVTYKMRVSRERRARWALRVLRITDATLRSCKTHTHTHRQSKGIKQNVDRFSNPILQLVTPSEPERERQRGCAWKYVWSLTQAQSPSYKYLCRFQ